MIETTAASQAEVIRTENLWRVYKVGALEVQALRGINLQIESGLFVVLRGRSGSGKTTLLNCLGGLDHPSTGEAWVLGRKLAQLNDDDLTHWRREQVGFVFQSFLVGLNEWSHHRPYEMSGGQQRVAIARSLANRPRLLLADEPTGELDSTTAREVLALFRQIVESEQLTLLMASHDPLVDEYADRVLLLKDGQIATQ